MVKPRTAEVVELAPIPSARLLDPHVKDFVRLDGTRTITRSSAEHLADLAWIAEWDRWQDDSAGKTMRAEHIEWWQAAIVGNVRPEWRDGPRRTR